jgi:transcriptional regulator with GAF, ATPase, and Fis domain
MRFSRTFGFRIAFGFTLVITAILINTLISQRLLSKIRNTQQEVTEITNPSIRVIREFRSIIQTDMPQAHQQIADISPKWDQGDRETYENLYAFIQVGEGLVGRCVQEGNTLFMTDIPDDYIRIKSGLGEDNPRCLLIVPLRLHEAITGVIEIATLESFEDFQTEFIERIGTSIASSTSAAFAEELKKTKT